MSALSYGYAKRRIEDYRAGRLGHYGKEAIEHDLAVIESHEPARRAAVVETPQAAESAVESTKEGN